ncbi:MAG: carboxypeptidase-like regulatory domain-containing protein [Flavobacteriales bacterium]|nr:carboxypeptidase-like regulatory domain-containing protein [Flavobacteriales bacterium]
MKATSIFLLILVTYIICIEESVAQENILLGKVVEHDENGHSHSLPGANIYWLGIENKGVAADNEGNFSIPNPEIFPASLIVSFIGKKNDTIQVMESPSEILTILLKSSRELEGIIIKGELDATSVSLFSNINTETISSKELKKAACCSVSESFETTATVDLKFDDGISGTKKIQMLGLDGVYAQILNENIPMIGGLSSGIGLGSIPGTWIESISVSKGAGSVVNGYESITGQINIDLIKPDKTDRVFYNVYGNSQGNVQVNMHLGHKLGKKEKWSSLMFLHMGDLSATNDGNKDSLLDMPLSRKYSLYNRWKYSGDNYHSQFGVKYLNDHRLGGQLGFAVPQATDTIPPKYGIGIDAEEIEIFAKNGYVFPEHPFQSIGLQVSAKSHRQNSYYGYGLNTYSGNENRLYANLIYQIDSKAGVNAVKFGSSYIYDDFNERFNDTTFLRTEMVPGVFTEYTYNKKKTTIVGGIRADYHNLYGLFISPRLHYKFNFKPKSTFRLSGGKGLRTANFFIENGRALASSREIVFQEALLPEVATNAGTSITHKFKFLNKPSSINVDYYFTNFESQVIADYDTDVDKVFVYNLEKEAKSFSHSFQIDFDFEIMKDFEVKLAYKYYDVQITYNGSTMSRPLIPTDRTLVNLNYKTKDDKWNFNLTNKYFGTSRIPSTEENPIEFQLKKKSNPYFMFNFQATRKFDNTECYAGMENITNYVQPNAIIDAKNPFGDYFDASQIWGPLAGRMFYLGMRLTIK